MAQVADMGLKLQRTARGRMHHPQAFASLEQGFEPAANADYAARFLKQLREGPGGGDWMKAAGFYHSQTPDRAEGGKAYLKSSLHFVGSGVPAMRTIVKAWLRAHPALTHDELFAVADALWAHPVHECRLAAVELLVQRPRLVSAADVPWIERTLRDCHRSQSSTVVKGGFCSFSDSRKPYSVYLSFKPQLQ